MRLNHCLLLLFYAWVQLGSALERPFTTFVNDPSLPSLYSYYTSGGIKSGLEDNGDQFTLNGRPIVLYSGSLHYFRVLPERWRAILKRFKAAGLNAVQLYVPWNLHEDTPGRFDFESDQLNLDKFLEMIRQEDMFAVVRPGPYICAEWEFGGFPSWLIRIPGIQFREINTPYLSRVKRYYDRVYRILNRHQFSVTGGPVIMAQIENEYFGAPVKHSLPYLRYLFNITRESGFKQLIFTSDNIDVAVNDPVKSIPVLLETANLNDQAYTKLMKFRTAQPGKPVYASEFWPGWFDSWFDPAHNTYPFSKFHQQASDILFRVNGSINYYVFIGGTNFGFMNGALGDDQSGWTRVVTSYDYDAPLTEAGNYTQKYYDTRKLYDQLVTLGKMPKLALPDHPPEVQKARAYGQIDIHSYYPLEEILEGVPKFLGVPKPVSMEWLNLGPEYGQRYGFVMYRVETSPAKVYEITGPIADRGIFMIDGNQTSITMDALNFTYTIPSTQWWDPNLPSNGHHLDILVENLGRPNWGVLEQIGQKGIVSGDIKINGSPWTELTIYSLDFNQNWLESFSEGATALPFQDPGPQPKIIQPQLYNTHLTLEHEPEDTYLRLPGWTKGNVFVNGFNIGRYWTVGPQKTLYIPAPLLHRGRNRIQVFELHQPGTVLEFVDKPDLG